MAAKPVSTQPQLGDRVVYHYPLGKGPNGSSMAAAIVTRVWTSDMVNLFIMGDLEPPHGRGWVNRQGSQYAVPEGDFWTPGDAP